MMKSTTLGFFNFIYLYVLLCVEDPVDRKRKKRSVSYVHNHPNLESRRISISDDLLTC